MNPSYSPARFPDPDGRLLAIAVAVRKGRLVELGLMLALAGACWAQNAERSSPSPSQATVPAAPTTWRDSPYEAAPYTPLSLKEKAYLFGYRVVQPSSFAKSAFTAAIAQWRDNPEEWPQGMGGFGRRYGHRLANRGVESAVGFGVASLLHQDARYFRGQGSFGSRMKNVLVQTFTAKKDDGGRTFPAWRVAGNYGAQFVSNAWRPPSDRGAGDAALRGTISIGYDVASNMFKEFWPDIRRRVFKK